MKIILLVSALVLTITANAQTSMNNQNGVSSNDARNMSAPREAALFTNQRLIVTSASEKKACGYLASDAKKTLRCLPDDSLNLEPRALYDFVVASEIASCGHIVNGHDQWQCWGKNPVYQPFDLSFMNGAKPNQVFNFASNLCRLDETGLLLCARLTSWSKGSYVKDNGGFASSPKQFGPFKNLKAASADYNGLCVIDGDEVKCQMVPYANTTLEGRKFSHPRLVSVSQAFMCVVDDDGGHCLNEDTPSEPLQLMPNWKTATALRSEGKNVCASLTNGKISCLNSSEMTPFSSNMNRERPKDLAGIVEYESNGGTSCIRRADGSVQCWGRIALDFVQPTHLDAVSNISVGTRHICASFTNGEATCWGDDVHGELNLPLKAGSPISVALNTGIECMWNNSGAACSGNVYSVSVNRLPTFNHLEMMSLTPISMGDSCAIDRVANGGTMAICWGQTQAVADIPTTLKNPTLIATSGSDACANSADQTVQCWGTSHFGPAPNATRHLRKLVVVGQNACALDDYGLMCWGEGQSPESKLKVPETVAMDGATIDVAFGNEQACALTFDHRVSCWGSGDLRVPDLKHPVAVNVIGGRTFCATDDDGLKCWGDLVGLPGQPIH